MCVVTRRTGNDPTTGKPGPVDAVRQPDGSIALVRRDPPTEAPLVARLRACGLLSIVERHARTHKVSVADVVGERRFVAVVRARHGVWRELRATTGYSYPEIADLFGRDHTTVMAACTGVRKATPYQAAIAAMRVV